MRCASAGATRVSCRDAAAVHRVAAMQTCTEALEAAAGGNHCLRYPSPTHMDADV